MSKKNKKKATNTTFASPASMTSRENFMEKSDAQERETLHSEQDRSRGKARMVPVTATEGDPRRYLPISEQSERYQKGREFGMRVIACSIDAVEPTGEPLIFADTDPTFTIAAFDALAEAGMLVDEVAAEAHRMVVEHAAMRRKT